MMMGVGRMGPQGDLRWANWFSYDGSGTLGDAGLSLDPTNGIWLSAKVDLFGIGPRVLTHRVDSNGVLLRSDLYAIPGSLSLVLPALAVLSTGEAIMQVRTTHMPISGAVARLSATGTVIESYATKLDTVGTVQRSFMPWPGQVRNDTWQTAADLLEKDLQFGTELRRTVLWRQQSPLSSACALVPVACDHVVVPPGTVSVIPGGTTSARTATLGAGTMSLAPLPIGGLLDLCILVSVDESLTPTFSLRMDDSGGHVRIDGPVSIRSGQWSLVDMTGRKVGGAAVGSWPLQVPLLGLSPGCYVVMLNHQGGSWSGRFIKGHVPR